MGISANAWPQAITAITLFTEDLAATKDFYGEIFGLPVVFEDDVSAVFNFGTTLVNLLSITAAPELIAPAALGTTHAGSRNVLTITVDDVDAICEVLQARGVTLLNGPMNRPWGIRTASFKDPSGQIWEIAK